LATPYAAPAVANTVCARSPPGPWALFAVATAGLVTAAGSLALGLTNDDVSPVQVALLEWIMVPYIAAGLVAWWRRPESRLGVLMIAGGFATGLSAVAFARFSGPHTFGLVFDVLPVVLFLHVYLAFPDGHLRSRLERVLVAAGWVAAIGLQLVKMSLGGVGPQNLLEITADPTTARTVEQVQLLWISASCVAGMVLLAVRRRHSGRPLRRPVGLLIDSFALGLVMIAVLFAFGAFEGPAFQEVQRATLIVIGISPFAFLIGLLDARLARSGVGDLFVELNADPSPGGLENALARALRDPSVVLAYWLPEFESWSDIGGRRVDLPDEGSGRATTLIDRDGSRLAAIVHEPELLDEPELLAAVGAAAGIALENGRLQAEQQAQLEELKGSRARVIEAGQKERQRLERNLHDGAQQRLIALSLELSLLEKQLEDDPAAATRLESARREIAVSLDELRAVARGLHPAVLSGHGLDVALQSIAAQSTTPVRLTVALEDRLPEQIEVAAYYVVSESLANIGKHARAKSVSVDVGRADGVLVVEVVDDGVGGADTDHGTGLRGLADRVEAHGGRLRVWSPVGGGTRLRAEMPCG
jgi:signal transduction histidine kinase